MKEARLSDILRSIARTRILVLGDFFLDQYWSIDPSLTESFEETQQDLDGSGGNTVLVEDIISLDGRGAKHPRGR